MKIRVVLTGGEAAVRSSTRLRGATSSASSRSPSAGRTLFERKKGGTLPREFTDVTETAFAYAVG